MLLNPNLTTKVFYLRDPDFQCHKEVKELSYIKNLDNFRRANPIHHFQNAFSDFNCIFHRVA